MDNTNHIHTPERDSNICKDCGQPIHTFEEPAKKLNAKSLNKTADKLNGVANKIGIALVLVVVGVFLFPLGIILWIIALGIIIGVFGSSSKT